MTKKKRQKKKPDERARSRKQQKGARDRVSLKQNLRGAFHELCDVFGISYSNEIETFVRKICRNHYRQLAELKIGRLEIAWSFKKGRRIISLVGMRDAEDRKRFNEWREMPKAAMLEERGITLDFAPYAASAQEVHWGAGDNTP